MRHAQPAPFLITSILLAASLHGGELRIFLSDENHRAVAGRLEVRGSDGKMYQADGQEPPFSGWIGLWWLLPIIGGIIWFVKVQGALNRYWEGKSVTAPAAAPAPAA